MDVSTLQFKSVTRVLEVLTWFHLWNKRHTSNITDETCRTWASLFSSWL